MAHAVQPRDGETDVEISIPNPADRAEVTAALEDGRTAALDGRFLVFLAGSHPYRDRLFEPVTQDPVPLGPFPETLSAKTGRYVYRVRKADRAGNLSAGGAMARLVVRVPSVAPGQAPDLLTFAPGDPPGRIRLRLPADAALTHLLAFSQHVEPGDGRPVQQALILRTPNRPDLYPDGGIWLRTPDGALLAPRVKALADADVIVDTDGLSRLALDFTADAGQLLRVWACSLTRDGVPSVIAGPWTLAIPLGPLPEPVLAASVEAGRLHFTWTWPPGPAFEVALERSADGVNWQRISPRLARTAAAYDTPRPQPPITACVYTVLTAAAATATP